MIDKEYPLGCMVKSKSGNKKVILGKPVEGVHQESTKGCIYPVTSYHNHKDDKKVPENKRTSKDLPKGFFKGEASKSKTTLYALNLTRLNEKLAEVYTGQQNKTQDPQNPSAPSLQNPNLKRASNKKLFVFIKRQISYVFHVL